MDISLLKNYSYFEQLKTMDKLKTTYPFISASSIGKSVMGKEIFALTLGAAEEYVLFVGGVHGNDNFSVGLLTAFFYELCNGLVENTAIEGLKVRKALVGRALIVIPCLNPDGCEIASLGKTGCGNILEQIRELAGTNLKSFRHNARGVDIDLNFCGRSAVSEPETKAALELLKQKPIRHAILFGSGNNELITLGGEKIPVRSNRMAEIMTATTGYGVSLNHNDPRREGFLKYFCGEYFKPAFKVLPNVPTDMIEPDYIKVYKELRELMMLTAIM